MSSPHGQALRVLEGRYVLEHDADPAAPLPEGVWVSLVHGPDGRTAVRRDDAADAGAWAALWSGEEAHDPEATGMLRALVAPLADAGLPVMVASTFTADLVLVPAERLDAAISALRAAGHRVAR